MTTYLRVVELQRSKGLVMAFVVDGVNRVLEINCRSLSRAEHETNHATGRVIQPNQYVNSKNKQQNNIMREKQQCMDSKKVKHMAQISGNAGYQEYTRKALQTVLINCPMDLQSQYSYL